MQKLQKLPTGIQSFSRIREGNMLYVDKTEYICNLIESGNAFFFSRPRRFGKSLLLSTLKEIYLGHKHYFEGLWIEDKIDWEAYPVVHLDMSLLEDISHTADKVLLEQLNSIASLYDLIIQTDTLPDYFAKLLRALHRKYDKRVVVLIDEYDAPLTNHLDNPEKIAQNQEMLSGFYGVLKGMDEYIHFIFLTGVSRYGKMSIFSKLNNLLDITFDDTFATMLGYTQEELEYYFKPYLEKYAKKDDISYQAALDSIKRWYNGYSFDGKTTVYTPWSILNFCYHLGISNYWFSTGTPTFLLKLMKDMGKPAYDLESKEGELPALSHADLNQIDLYALLYQTGYLTIKKVIRAGEILQYELGYPNQEVRLSYLNYLLAEYSDKQISEVHHDIISKVRDAVYKNNLEKFFTVMKATFAAIPYNMFIHNLEAYYQSVIYLVMNLSNLLVRGEEQTNIGRIDTVLESPTHIYIFEFKMTTPEDALAQIHEKKYYEKYQSKNKPIILIGVAFDEENKTVREWKSELLSNS
jgi:hypothetical protein